MDMQAPLSKLLTVAVAAVLALGTFDAAFAGPKKKPRLKQQRPPIVKQQRPAVQTFQRDIDGTPIIMQGYGARRAVREESLPAQRGERPVAIPRGSSTYIPPPVPSPYTGPPSPSLLQPGPGVYNPPPINSFGDRVTNCIHSAPLNAGVGNNPTDRQMYIRQCAN